MARKIDGNCSQCAYVEKWEDGMWCPFHDEEVSGNLVCDDFLDEFHSPLYISLANDAKIGVGTIIKDVIGYAVVAASILLGALVIVLGV